MNERWQDNFESDSPDDYKDDDNIIMPSPWLFIKATVYGFMGIGGWVIGVYTAIFLLLLPILIWM